MNYLKAVLLAAVLIATPAVACDVNTNNTLSKQERQELIVLCEQMKAKRLAAEAANPPKPKDVVEKLSEVDADSIAKISVISDSIVKVITGVANGLGVAANTFIQSPAGIFLSTLLVFYLAGSSIITIGLLLTVLLCVRWFLMFLHDRYSFMKEEYVQVPRFWGLYSVQKRIVHRAAFKDWEESSKNEFKTSTGISAIVFCVSVVVCMIFV